ncbi:MAG: hypothetical protein K0T99_04060 [Alphaproteobacteria bacterium]|nr:hypothetical protein [Alphaproteobacteria bacterium]
MIKILSELLLHPGIFLILSYLIAYLFQGNSRKTFIIIAPIVAMFLLLITVGYGSYEFFISFVFLIVLWAGCLLAYTGKVNDKENAQLALLYFGAAIAVIITSNLFLIFIFFEIMLVAATFMIFNGKNRLSSVAGITYFKFHILAGILFLIGSITYYAEYGNFQIALQNFSEFSTLTKQIINIAILLSLLINIATPPCSYWLIEGYAATTPSGSVFLSVATTKVALFLMAKLFLGFQYLIYIGIFMGVYGILYAALESNIRRILNFSIISQLGIILIAIGIGGSSGSEAAIFMIVTESVYIGLSMVCAAILFFDSGSKRYFQMNETFGVSAMIICSIVAFASISSMPFTPGYVGKYLLYKSEYVISNPWLKYTISSLTAGITFSVGIKIPMFVFCKKNHDKSKEEKPRRFTYARKASLISLTLLTLLFGIFPEIITGKKIEFFDQIFFNHSSLLLGSFAGFFLLGKILAVKKKYALLEFEWMYRYVFMKIYRYIESRILRVVKFISEDFMNILKRIYDNMEVCFGESGTLVSIKSQRNITLLIVLILILLIVKL